LIKQLRSQEVGIIYISHFLEEVFRVADRITVLKDGRVIETKTSSDTSLPRVIRSMIGRDPSLFYQRERPAIGETVLEVRRLTRGDVLRDISFELRRGEILGFGGMVGAGRSELMNAVFGAERPDSGEIYLKGRLCRFQNPTDAIRSGLALIPEDRKELGLFTLRSVLENAAIVSNQAKGPLLHRRGERRTVTELVRNLRIVTSGLHQPVGVLSGGNQQKVVLGRWLATRAEIFIFDEPTRGVDIGAKEQIYELMIGLIKAGKSILMVSSDMPELISLSDRIAVLREGTLVTILDARQATEEKLLEFFLGVAENSETSL
jgi:ribose transport system ATP-binding protein